MEMAAEQSEGHSEEQCPSSEVTVTTTPPTLRRFSYQTLAERKQKDVCFRCRKQGHWAQDCLSLSTNPTAKASSQSSPPPSPPLDIHHLPVLRCHCGVACTICVSRSDANYGRRYYARNCNCDNVKATQGRNFYKWCDDFKALMCKCGAGACTINIQRNENRKDTKYYTCRIRTGHGSCGFLQFDSPPNSWPRSVAIEKKPSILSPQHGRLPNIMIPEDERSISSFPNRNIAVREAETCNFVMSQSDIHSRQIEFWNQISAAGNLPNGCRHHWQYLFSFSPCFKMLFVAAVLVFISYRFSLPLLSQSAGIFPLFDLILGSKHVDISDGGSSSIMLHVFSNAEVDEVSQNALKNDYQLLGVPLGTSSLERSFTAMQEGVTNPILKEAGKNLQKDLTHLESMEPLDHNTMLQAVNDTFDTLASLLIDYRSFAQLLVDSIRRTSIVARMGSTLQDNCYQHSIPKNIEECFYDISGIQAEAFATRTACSNYLQSVHEAASHIKDMLYQIEKLETYLLNAAKDVGQSEKHTGYISKADKILETFAGGRKGKCVASRTALDEFK